MRWYADLPTARLRQIAGDLAVLAWVVLSWLVSSAAFDAVQRLAGPGIAAEHAADRLANQLESTSERAADVPLVGEQLAVPLQQAADAGRDLAGAARGVQVAVGQVALGAFLVVLLLALVPVLLRWLPARVAQARETGALRHLMSASVPDSALFPLLAGRAVAELSYSDLARHGDLVRRFAEGDAAAARALAELELRRHGLKAPRQRTE